MFDGCIDVGNEFTKHGTRFRVTRIVDCAGIRKVWIVRSDGANITDRQKDTWEYEESFREKFDPVEGVQQ